MPHVSSQDWCVYTIIPTPRNTAHVCTNEPQPTFIIDPQNLIFGGNVGGCFAGIWSNKATLGLRMAAMVLLAMADAAPAAAAATCEYCQFPERLRGQMISAAAH